MDAGSFPHQLTLLVFDTGQPYEAFRARYEAAVPALDEKRLAGFAARGAAWPQVVADADAAAPHGFLIFWRLDTTPVMSLAGNSARCTAYLMGNHTIAEQMYRHDPAVMLYLPLRTVIYAGPDDRAFFAADQPSTQSPPSASPRSPRWAPTLTASSSPCSVPLTSRQANSLARPDHHRERNRAK
jgi:hypothetical protein